MMKSSWLRSGVAGAMVIGALGAVGAAAADGADGASVQGTSPTNGASPIRLAWLGNSPINTYDNAIRDAAAAVGVVGRAKITPYYALWNANTQLQQCLGAVRSGSFDAVMILANDSVGILPCVAEADARGIPVVALDLPIGSNMATVEPQVAGQVGAVLVPPAKWGADLSALVVDRCASISPCNVVYLAGTFGIALDDIAIQKLQATTQTHPHIRLVATAEAFYTEADAYTITKDLLAQHPSIHVVIGAGDQMAQGAERAISEAGSLPHPIDIVGAGAGAYGVQAVQDGRWYATFVALPADEGALGADIALRAVRGEPIPDPGINPAEQRGYPAFYTRENQAQFVDFIPQWPG